MLYSFILNKKWQCTNLELVILRSNTPHGFIWKSQSHPLLEKKLFLKSSNLGHYSFPSEAHLPPHSTLLHQSDFISPDFHNTTSLQRQFLFETSMNILKEFYFSNGTFMENFLFSYNWLRQNGLFNSGGWYGLSWLEILVGSCVSRSVLLVKSSVQGLCVP